MTLNQSSCSLYEYKYVRFTETLIFTLSCRFTQVSLIFYKISLEVTSIHTRKLYFITVFKAGDAAHKLHTNKVLNSTHQYTSGDRRLGHAQPCSSLTTGCLT